MATSTFPTNKLPNDLIEMPIYEEILRAKREVSASFGDDFHALCEHFRQLERESGRVVVTRQRPAKTPA